MKHFAIFVGACLALSGCVIETSTGNGGSAGDGGAGVGGNGGSTGGQGGSVGGQGGSVGGQGGTGGSTAACATCAEYITDGQGELCEASADLYNTLVDCICVGNCADVCTDNICAGGDLTADCQTCIGDTAAGCGNEFNECSNDF
ncbi:MAG: hypothetical protein R3B70_16650 [Polyangiaceae bacterium]